MRNDRSLDSRWKINLSLRLWSDHVSIAALLKRSSFEVEHCHHLGETIAIGGRSTDRVARRHYASLQNCEASDRGEISKWLAGTQEKINASDEIRDGLRSKKIEGVIWIALFGIELQPAPHIDPGIVKQYFQQCVKILIENYTDLDAEGLPQKTWLLP